MSKTLHIVSILDRSGSMSGTEKEVIGAYNDFIEKQKKIATENAVSIKSTLILFDHEYTPVYTKMKVEAVQPLTEEQYQVRGWTALCDAIGKAVEDFKDKKRVIFFIETDGEENSSKEYNAEKVKKLVEQKTKDGWDFNFVGADLSTIQTQTFAGTLGISKSLSFDKSAMGYATRNAAFADATTAYLKSNITSKS